ncbi:helix-turn-helix domain-containing protein [Haloferacaceae archaeon DSL9]
MYEATFRIDDGGPYAVSTAGTDARVELWCNEHCDLLHAAGDDLDPLVDAVEAVAGVRETLSRDGEVVLVTNACLKESETDHIERYLRRHGCLLLPPLRYAAGAKYCRLLALDPAALTAVYRDLVDDGYRIDVESKRRAETVRQDGPLLSPESVLPTLTARQREVLTVAYDGGYYDIPRGVTTADIADAVGIGRRTAEDHLRRAEAKVVSGLMPYLRG